MSVLLNKMVRIIFYSNKQNEYICCYLNTSITEVEKNLEEIKPENNDGCNKEEVNKPNIAENNNENENKPVTSSGFKRTKTKHYK